MRSTSERDFPGFDHLFDVGDPGTERPFRASVADKRIEQALRGEWVPEEPLAARWYMGGPTPGDIVQTAWAGPMFVSDHVLALLHEHGITGWRTYPVSLTNKAGEQISGYHGLAIVGRFGEIDYHRSVMFMQQYPAGKFPEFRGLYFDEDSWDGSDLFMPSDHTTFIFCTEAVQVAFKKARIRNIVFTPLPDVRLTPLMSPILKARAEE